MNRNDDPQKRHHRESGFQNNYEEFVPKSLADVLRWRWNAARNGLPRKPQTATPRIDPDLQFLKANAAAGTAMVPSVTWIGHATVLAQLRGINLLTDPVFSDRASPFSFVGPKRHVAPGVSLGDLPHVEFVLISHNHYDHLDGTTVDALAAQAGGPPTFVVPLGLKSWFEARGIATVVELDWWQCHLFTGSNGVIEILLCPAQHWSARGLNDRMKTLWGGFAIIASDCHFFFAGDTAYSRDFEDIRAHLAPRQTFAAGGGFDIAILPIGAYEPRWFMQDQHVNTEEAVKIHQDLGAKSSLGVHWGTFELTDEALDEPPRALAQDALSAGLRAGEFFVLAVGETRRIAERQRR